MTRYLILPLAILVIVAFFKIYQEARKSLKISREKARRDAEHREFVMAYNTRRQLYSEVYSVSRKYKLSGNTSAEMQENISHCSEDDDVDIEFDHDKNRYAASCNGGNIGYLPPDANDTLSKVKDCKAIINAIGFTNADKYFTHISVFYNE